MTDTTKERLTQAEQEILAYNATMDNQAAEIGRLKAELEAALKDRVALAVQVEQEPDYKRMFAAAVSQIAEISDALGVDADDAACANGNDLILLAIARKNKAILAAITRVPDAAQEGGAA